MKNTVATLALLFAALFTCVALAGCINITVNVPPSSESASSSQAASSSENDADSSGYSTEASSAEQGASSSSSYSGNAASYGSNSSGSSEDDGNWSSSQGASNQVDSFEVDVPEDDDSYAEKHKSGSEYVAPDITVQKDGQYTDKDSVALYIHLYGTVPSNYISKTKARKEGWVNTKGNLWDVCPGMSIGGGGFYNDDNTMPDAPGREWFECDIDYEGGFRNAKRLVYSNDGLIYYTDDHYKTFQSLY